MRRVEYEFWCSVVPVLDDDADVAFSRIAGKTGKIQSQVARNILAIFRLGELPKVKALQDAGFILDMQALVAIDQVLAKLGKVEGDILEQIDNLLAAYLTPTKPNQVFPTVGKIRRRLRDICRALDPTIAFYNPQKKDAYRCTVSGSRAYIELDVEAAHGVVLHEIVAQVAKEHQVTLAEALVLLISGSVTPEAGKVVIYSYRASDVENAPTYVQGHGWMTGDIPAKRERHRDFSEAPKETAGYGPSEDVRKYVEGRDLTCRAPTCDQPAYLSQLDHRINYRDGGKTHPSNMVALCQHHHNMKTDGRAFYILDPDTGDVVWLFEDGTWLITEAEGPLAPKVKRWAQTVGQSSLLRTVRRRTNGLRFSSRSSNKTRRSQARRLSSTATTAGRGATKTSRSDPQGANEFAASICDLAGEICG